MAIDDNEHLADQDELSPSHEIRGGIDTVRGAKRNIDQARQIADKIKQHQAQNQGQEQPTAQNQGQSQPPGNAQNPGGNTQNGLEASTETAKGAGQKAINSTMPGGGTQGVQNAMQSAQSGLEAGSSAGASASAGANATATAGATAGAEAGATAGGAAATGGAAAGGGAAAAGAAAGPVGLAVSAAVMLAANALKKAKGEIADATNSKSETDVVGGGGGLIGALIGIIAVILFAGVALVATPAVGFFNAVLFPYTALVEGLSEIRTQVNYQIDTAESYMIEADKQKFFEELFGANYASIADQPVALSEESLEVCKKIVDHAIYVAFDHYAWNLILNLGTWQRFLFDGYNPYATYQKFRANPYPYELKRDNGTPYHTVGNFIDNPSSVTNNDLNYAEIFTVLCQSEKLNIDSFSYYELYDMLINASTTELLFEMQIGDNPTMYEYGDGESAEAIKIATESGSKNIGIATLGNVDGREIIAATEEDIAKKLRDSELTEETTEEEKENLLQKIKKYVTAGRAVLSIVTADVKEHFVSWFKHFFFVFDVKVMPYGLDELYDIAGMKPLDMNVNCIGMRNIDMLDESELWLRGILPHADLGPSFLDERPTTSVTYGYIREMQTNFRFPEAIRPTGRSATNYVDNSFVKAVKNGDTFTQEWLDGESIMLTLDYNPNGETVILDMFGYINQGDYKNEKRGKWDGKGTDPRPTISKSGCIDCSYTMVYEYFYRVPASITQISRDYVIDELFQAIDFLPDHGLAGNHYGGVVGSGATTWDFPFDIDAICAEITAGRPVIMSLKGHWEYGGKIYHQNDGSHFLVIMGYDSTGFYVYDPGSRRNTGLSENSSNPTPIPYEAFAFCDYKKYRTFAAPPEIGELPAYYKINTISGIGLEPPNEE